MDINKITSLSELWEQQQTAPMKSAADSTHMNVMNTANKIIADTDNSHNDMYKSAIFKKLWSKKLLHLSNEPVLTGRENLRQPDLFEHLDDYPQHEHNRVIFSNGMFYSTIGQYTRGYFIWRDTHSVSEAYNSLVDVIHPTMPGALATRLTQAVNVLNINTNGDFLITSDVKDSNEATINEHWSIKEADEPLLNSGVYIVRICKGNNVRIKETHVQSNTVYCNRWIYIVDYGATLEIERHVLQAEGVIDSTHVIQYPGSRLKINTHDRGNQWRNIDITAYQKTVTEVNGSTLLKDSDSANFIDVQHKGYDGNSNIKYNSAIYNSNTGNFIGTVQVEKKAVGTKSKMTNKNLLIDPLSRAFSKPILHINTKEIECTHGCTTSKISEDELYYLQSLGVDRGTAKTIIANGHIQI